jgi:hypothetical protein
MASHTKEAAVPKSPLARAHLAAAAIAVAMITAFLAVSAVTELAGSPGEVRAARQGIVTGLPLLVACLATTGITGRRLAGRSRSSVIRAKQRRLAAAAVIGLAVLIPCALLLYFPAAARAGRPAVTALEITEWAFGSVNLCLLVLNFRAGLRMSKRRGSPAGSAELSGSRR